MKKQLIIAYNGKSVSVLVAEPRLTADQLGQHEQYTFDDRLGSFVLLKCRPTGLLR